MIEALTDKILELYCIKGKPLIISITGAADVGKSTMTKSLVRSLQERGYVADTISCDMFLLNRNRRNELGISGYAPQANNLGALRDALSKLVGGESFAYFEYDHRLGQNSSISRNVFLNQILIIEGLHTFYEGLAPYVDFKIFIDGSREILNRLRSENNVHKRMMNPSEAIENAQKEYDHYAQYILPYKAYADLVVKVEDGWNYQ